MSRRDLRPGILLAEGGEGRVFEVPDRPGVLYKEYRRPVDVTGLQPLVEWAVSPALTPDMRARVAASAAWPSAVVTERPGGTRATGLLLPRSPRRFSLRHRDGASRLATLSYLTADPVRRASAYGLALPAEGDPLRIGLVYALARLLEALESTDPPVSHGDLSAKNVLWSTQRGPEVFVIDCDNGERFDPAGRPLGAPGRRRAMTPNWDDPSIPPGANPGPAADRYSLALVFLRVVGAAHYPVQKRQRTGEAIEVTLELPPPMLRAAALGPGAPVWDVVGRALSVADPAGRPPASAWAAVLHDVLDDLGARGVIDAVHRSQGSSQRPAPAGWSAGPAPDVAVGPRAARRRPPPVSLRPVPARRGARPPAGPPVGAGPATTGTAGTWNPAGRGAPGRPGVAPAPAAPILAPVRAGLVSAVAAWADLHRRAVRTARSPGGAGAGAARLAACALLDFALACVALLLFAMIVSPFLGI